MSETTELGTQVGRVSDDSSTDPVPAPVKIDTPTKRADHRRHTATGMVLVAAPTAVVLVFVAFPVFNALLFSLGFTGGINSTLAEIGQDIISTPSFAVFENLFHDSMYMRDLGATLIVTFASTVLTIGAACVISIILRLYGGYLGKLLSILAVVPLFVPVVIASWAILTFYDGTGFLRSVAASLGFSAPTWGFTLTAVTIGSVWTSLPFAVLLIAGAMQGIPDALLEAAHDAGAGNWQAIWHVLLPLAKIPLTIASTFTFIGVLGSFTVPYFTGPNSPTMLGVDLSRYFTAFNRPQQSTAQAFVVFAFASVAAGLYLWATMHSNEQTS
ncbi:ABC transporter permease [Propionibacterium cyclohexanicum]|uniref:ABC transporter permease n=1 Tax=Propionibacterium cyclohexanicum TaxID=64702 RepID=UPI001C4361F0|nr:ABC transporter permease subunit [Propionibacterium cyclohexanicum]